MGQPHGPAGIIDIATWSEHLFQYEFGKFAKLQPHHERVLRYAFSVDENGKLPFRTVILSERKKSAKTLNAAIVNGWFADQLAPPGDELIIVANDLDQAAKRVYRAVQHAYRWHPHLAAKVELNNNTQLLLKNGTRINPISSDYGSAAGANFGLVSFDEPWAYMRDSSRRLFTELTPTALTRPNSVRLMTGYAGWSGESILWEELYKKGINGRKVLYPLPCYVVDDMGLFMLWSHEALCSWQQGPEAEEYYRQERATLPPGEFERIHENQWQSTDQGLDINDWDACIAMGQELEHRTPAEGDQWLCVGIDAGWKKDRCAVRSVYRHEGRYRQGPGISWLPRKGEHFDFENTVEAYVKQLKQRFHLEVCYYDPTQMVRSAATLRRAGINMKEWAQTEPNLLMMGNHFFDLIRERNLVLDPDDVSGETQFLRRQAQSIKLNVTNRGVIIKKRNANHAIDDIIALVMACIAAKNSPDRSRNFKDAFFSLPHRRI